MLAGAGKTVSHILCPAAPAEVANLPLGTPSKEAAGAPSTSGRISYSGPSCPYLLNLVEEDAFSEFGADGLRVASCGTVNLRSPRESAYVFAEVRVGLHQDLDVPVLDVGGLHARPFRAREQGVAAPPVAGERCGRCPRV